MFFEHRTFWLPKDLSNAKGYQDASEVAPEAGVAAIADGVSSSLFSGSWAQLLVKGVVADPPAVFDANLMHPWLNLRREAWRAPIDVNTLAWHQKPKFQEGAFSTLLWIEMFHVGEDDQATGPYQVRCYAYGDCTLFHCREGRVVRAFPFEDSKLFGVEPPSLGSVDRQQDHLLQFQTLEDYVQPHDLLVLTTDALALWALVELEAGRSPDWESFWSKTDDEFREQIVQLRQENRIRFDDTTLVLLRVADAPASWRGRRTSDVLADHAHEAVDAAKQIVDKTVDDVKKLTATAKEKLSQVSAWFRRE